MDPRIRIRIHTKMSWIRNTAYRHKRIAAERSGDGSGKIDEVLEGGPRIAISYRHERIATE
jgi:hypothetical protein